MTHGPRSLDGAPPSSAAARERCAEEARLQEDGQRNKAWKRWGPYLAERQWSTVREDYSGNGEAWGYFPHEQARSRAYRWGEDGILGVCDWQGRVCFALSFWNERDPILKERLFGLTGLEGNHGEDVKEDYFYVDSTPTHSYMKGLYAYPHAEFPYRRLIEENRGRSRRERELDLVDTGIFDEGWFEVTAEYAKASPDDLLVRVTIRNRGHATARLHFLPTLWLRNTWAWGRTGEGYWPKGSLVSIGDAHAPAVALEHPSPSIGKMRFFCEPRDGMELLFTENETNSELLFKAKNVAPYVKDAFHARVVGGKKEATSPHGRGTKVAPWYRLELPAQGSTTLKFRLTQEREVVAEPLGRSFDDVFTARVEEADAFYERKIPRGLTKDARSVMRQAYAGLLWSKQFYNYEVEHWITGDPNAPASPAGRLGGRNADWRHVHCRDVVSMPDKWEYPWFAAWDLAFHMVPFARIDPEFAKQQLLLFLREWYMHPNGQLPAYEWNFADVNPPVHAWAAFRVYKLAAGRGHRDHAFLARVFQKLLMNFTWWVNRKDPEGNNVFGGGFLGLDNVGVFDRSRPLPVKGHLAQADGTAWMAFYCVTMLSIALELAKDDPVYEDMASKFFEHFVAITDAINTLGGTGLWDEKDGFYYDQIVFENGSTMPLRIRSIIGIIPLFACGIIEEDSFANLEGFAKRTKWFLDNRQDLARHIAYMEASSLDQADHQHRLLAIPSKDRLVRVLARVLDEKEFLSPFGVRSLSRVHEDEPYVLRVGGEEFKVEYTPAESEIPLFGGNSNWRGPIWIPTNYLLVEALERYHHFYGDALQVECPTGSGKMMNLRQVAREIGGRVARLFLRDQDGKRPSLAEDPRFVDDPVLRDLVLFHEYFDADAGRGCGASHQTGWTALVARMLEKAGEDT